MGLDERGLAKFNIENERFSDRRIKRMMRRKLKIATKLKLDRLNRS